MAGRSPRRATPASRADGRGAPPDAGRRCAAVRGRVRRPATSRRRARARVRGLAMSSRPTRITTARTTAYRSGFSGWFHVTACSTTPSATALSATRRMCVNRPIVSAASTVEQGGEGLGRRRTGARRRPRGGRPRRRTGRRRWPTPPPARARRGRRASPPARGGRRLLWRPRRLGSAAATRRGAPAPPVRSARPGCARRGTAAGDTNRSTVQPDVICWARVSSPQRRGT